LRLQREPDRARQRPRRARAPPLSVRGRKCVPARAAGDRLHVDRVIHHFRGRDLDRFLGEQATQARAFAHFDVKPSWLAPVGSWVFDQSRMRAPLARHDGVLSARRAHSAATLGAAARRACPDHAIAVFDGRRERLPLLRVMQALIGIRQDLAERLRIELGPLAARLAAVS